MAKADPNPKSPARSKQLTGVTRDEGVGKLPVWLPPVIGEEAARIQQELKSSNNPANALDLLGRLVQDDRMEAVWFELLKRKRHDQSAFLHPGTLQPSGAARWRRTRAQLLREQAADLKLPRKPEQQLAKKIQDAENLERIAEIIEEAPKIPVDPRWTDQELAIRHFFGQAYLYALHDTSSVSVAESHSNIEPLLTIAQRLREDAETLRSFGMEENAIDLENISNECEQYAEYSSSDEDDVGIVTRHRGNRRVNGYLAHLANTSRTLFGSLLHGTLATITNVALGSDLTADEVHGILRSASWLDVHD